MSTWDWIALVMRLGCMFAVISTIVYGLVRWARATREIYREQVKEYNEWLAEQAALTATNQAAGVVTLKDKKEKRNKKRTRNAPRVASAKSFQKPLKSDDISSPPQESRAEREERDYQMRELASKLADSV